MTIDPYYYPFTSVGFPDSYKYVSQPENFGVYLLGDTSDKRKVFVYTDRQEFGLSSKRDSQDVKRLFINLADKLSQCDTANDLFYLADLHPIHHVKINGQKIAVYRLRKNDLRLCLVQISSDLVLFRLCTKRQDKITKSEANIIDIRVRAIFDYPVHDPKNIGRIL